MKPSSPVAKRTWLKRVTVATLSCVCLAALARGEEPKSDEQYVQEFLAQYPKVEPAPDLNEYASAERYDELYMGERLDAALAKVSNDSGGIAWGLSYRMMSLNDMYQVTGHVKYLEANLKCIRAVLAVTDDKLGKPLWTGKTVPAWGSDKYADRGRAVFAVHTGIITAPMFEFLLLARENAAFRDTLGDEFQVILDAATAALAVHDRQWRDGPGDGEGHYIGLDQEEVCENKPLPGNRLSAMGLALWPSWKVSGNTTHRDRALALGRYIKDRLTPSPDGGYYWPYWLPEGPVTEPAPRESVAGEDTSHAGLTLALPLVLAADGQVFTNADLKRFAATVTHGFGRLGNGILLSRITGTTELAPSYVGGPAKWLLLEEVDPAVREPIRAFYLNYKPTPAPLELSRLMRCGQASR